MDRYEFYRKLDDKDLLVRKAQGYVEYLAKKPVTKAPVVIEPVEKPKPKVVETDSEVKPLSPNEIVRVRKMLIAYEKGQE